MNPLISVSINVNKITKEKLYQGKNGKYLNITLIPSPKSEYGDYMVVEQTSKAERAQGVKGAILGNGKLIEPKSSRAEPAPAASDDSDSIPF